MRPLCAVLTVLLVLIQGPLWFGKGGWIHVWELDRKLDKQLQINLALGGRNDALEAEVKDLHEGRAAVEERARYELGMIRNDEVFVQINVPAGEDSGLRNSTPTRTASLQ